MGKRLENITFEPVSEGETPLVWLDIACPLRAGPETVVVAGSRSYKSATQRQSIQPRIGKKCNYGFGLIYVDGRWEVKDQNVIPLFRGMDVSLIGNSPAMTCVMDFTKKFARSDSIVLILGPSGTGKELVAKLIHCFSKRSGGPFVPVNCGALPQTLIESELFGSTIGAFSGATNRIGRFEAAKGGTIFLDEIGDMPLAAQVKLLRTLQERSIQRLGDNLDRPVDCRVVAATNKDLETACKDGTFRIDLFHRLAVGIIELSPLSERSEDIPLLVDHLLRKLTLRNYGQGHPAFRISDKAMNVIMSYPFPGNVRELENMIERAILLSDGKLIDVENLPETVRRGVKVSVAPTGPDHVLFPRLLEALKAPTSQDAGSQRNKWSKSIRTVKVEDIAWYLAETGGREFSRKDFEVLLRRRGSHGMDKNTYATAGRYLRAMIEKGVINHNGGKANRSRFRVSDTFFLET